MRYVIDGDNGGDVEVEGFPTFVALALRSEGGVEVVNGETGEVAIEHPVAFINLTAQQVIDIQFALNRAREGMKKERFPSADQQS